MQTNVAHQTTTAPKITIITIVRNGLPYIEQTIKSVVNQSYKELEYIVIDGCSSDGTVEIIKTYETSIFKWLSEKDEGISDAFNKGLSYATGDYVLFLNADDALIDENVIHNISNLIIQSDFPTLLYGDCNVIERVSSKFLYQAIINFTKEDIYYGKMMPHPSLFTSKIYFKKYGNFDTQFEVAMDFEWLVRGAHENVIHVNLPVTSVRDGGVSTLNQKKAISEIILALKINGYITSIWAELKLKIYFYSRSAVRSTLETFGVYKFLSLIKYK